MERSSADAAHWSLVTYLTGDDPSEHLGVFTHSETVCGVPELSKYPGLLPALDHWTEVSAALADLDVQRLEPVPDARVLTPLRYPRKILCAGANYWSHLLEMGGSRDQPVVDPYFFLVPATTIVGPGDSIEVPMDDDAKVDWEGELAVVIGQRARKISVEGAPACVAGYTICNDVSARGLHKRASFVAPPFEFDWLMSKGRDTFLPMGPSMTPSWLIDDPHDLRLRVWVNDKLKQDARTSDLIADIWQLVAAASAVLTLEPGDVITTGTPAGVGHPRGEYLRPGDVVTIEIEGLGRLSNPVRAESAAEAPVLVDSMTTADAEA
jgi:2-keto-4-pentenoate hydratase/2-oxohepta-3-ene-1,7-dioic acid hydratase in catechol pathway